MGLLLGGLRLSEQPLFPFQVRHFGYPRYCRQDQELKDRSNLPSRRATPAAPYYNVAVARLAMTSVAVKIGVRPGFALSSLPKSISNSKKVNKYAGEVCYFCGVGLPETDEDIPGRMFGVTSTTGGLMVPACAACNKGWVADQEFIRLRVTLHGGSKPGGKHILEKEARRIVSSEYQRPSPGRYAREIGKLYVADGNELLGLTDGDLRRFDNVLTHWAAGIHYFARKAHAAVPGTVYQSALRPDIFDTISLRPQPDGKWKEASGDFGSWWFLPRPLLSESATVIQLLGSPELRFLVRFPALKPT